MSVIISYTCDFVRQENESLEQAINSEKREINEIIDALDMEKTKFLRQVSLLNKILISADESTLVIK